LETTWPHSCLINFRQGSLSFPTDASAQDAGSLASVAAQPADSYILPLASPEMDSVRSSVKIPADGRAMPQEKQVARGRVMYQDQQATASSEIFSGVARSRPSLISGSGTLRSQAPPRVPTPGILNRTRRPFSLWVGPPWLLTILLYSLTLVRCQCLAVPVRRSSSQLPHGRCPNFPS
jgi:hypothetical protein